MECQAQDVAEAAKQERARKEAQQKKPKHVYTDEDLKRAQILTPEDRAQLEAARSQPPPAATGESQPAADRSAVARDVDNAAVPPQIAGPSGAPDLGLFLATPGLDAQPLPPDTPLGDVARRFRQRKLAQDLQRSAEFHLPFPEAPVLASPKAPLEPWGPPFSDIKRAAPAPDFHAALPSAVLKSNSRRLPLPPPSLYPSRPPLPILKPAHPQFAPSQPLVRRSPFSRPPAAVFGPSRINPSRPAAGVVPRSPTAHTSSPAPQKPRVITVQPGDSLWSIAEHHLGHGLRWHDLVALNPGILNPDRIIGGTQLYLPAAASSPEAGTKFTVRQGDTLSQIAQSHFGHASYATCIARLNPSVRDANRIYAGQSLLLPATCKRSF